MAENVNTPPPPFQFNVPFELNILNAYGRPFAYRPNVQEDVAIIHSIFQIQEYALPVNDFEPKLIVDCGGDIGCSAVYFANRYPSAQIYVIEPELNHIKILQFNTILYDQIHVIPAALWDKETSIRVEDKGFGDLGWMTVDTTADDPAAMKTVTIGKILAESGFDEIDLLKIDIEGAEKEIFSAPDVDSWLSKVKVLTIELHDRMKPGCSDAFFKAVSKYHWHFELRGENLIFMREET